MLEWLEQHGDTLVWASVASGVMLVGSLLVGGWYIVRLPADHFKREDGDAGGGDGSPERRERRISRAGDAREPAQEARGGRFRVVLRIGKNVLGWALVLAGAAMLVLPGQGVLVLLVGIMLADFPGKRGAVRWILSRGRVMRTINWLRRRFDRPPLEPPGAQPRSRPGGRQASKGLSVGADGASDAASA